MIEPALALPPLEAIAARVADETGMVFTGPGGPERLERAVRLAIARAGAGGEAFLARLDEEPRLLEDLIDELSVGETYFFRHHEQLRFVADEILPGRLAARGDGPLRLWSAGCSSGEEPYSLAMLLAERGLLGRARIFATDVSSAALARARRGRYGPWSLRGEGAQRALPFLRREGDELVVAPELRHAVEFRRMNLAAPGDEGPRGMDLVLCRNVLIYLDRAAVIRAAARLLAALEPGGWLVAGPSEPLLGALAPFEVVTTGAGVYYRKPGRRPDPPALPAPRRPAFPPAARRAAAPPPAGPRPAAAESARDRPRREPGAGSAALDGTSAGPASLAEPPPPAAAALAEAAAALEAGRDVEAALALRQLVYADPTLAIGQYLLGEALRRLGDAAGARRAFAAASRIARSLPPDELLHHGNGERAGRLADAAADAALRLEAAP